MENNLYSKKSDLFENEIDFRKLFEVIWGGKWIVLTITSFFILAAIIHSISLPNIYKSTALLSPVDQQNSINNTMRSYGGLATLAGINIPTQSNASNSIKAIDKVNSLSFFSDNILPNIFLPNLMAVKSWDSISNTIYYDASIYNESTKKWIRNSKIPTVQESFNVFKNKHLEISEDKNTGFITISVKHQSPHVAKTWVDLIVKEINYFFRAKDKVEATAAIDYLNIQIAQTSFTEIKEVIAQLLQQKTQLLTLIEVSDFYVFEYIDPPAVMESKSEPNRLLMCILSALIGITLGIVTVLIRDYSNRTRK